MIDNENQPIFKGHISRFGDDRDEYGAPTSASVIPITAPDAPTRLYPILYIARDPRCDLQIDTEVVCARFEDGTGIILGRADGNYTGHFPGNATFGDSVRVRGAVSVEGDVSSSGSITAQNTVTGVVDVIGGGKSLAHHTHSVVQGGTTQPN